MKNHDLYFWLQHQAVAFMLADMAIGVEAARLLTQKSSWQMDQGIRNTFLASLAKSFASDVANKNATDCVQVIMQSFLKSHKISIIYNVCLSISLNLFIMI